MHLTAIKEKRKHEFENEKGREYGDRLKKEKGDMM